LSTSLSLSLLLVLQPSWTYDAFQRQLDIGRMTESYSIACMSMFGDITSAPRRVESACVSPQALDSTLGSNPVANVGIYTVSLDTRAARLAVKPLPVRTPEQQ